MGPRARGEEVEEFQKATCAAAAAAPGPCGLGRGQQASQAGMRAVKSEGRRNDQGKAQGCFESPSPPSRRALRRAAPSSPAPSVYSVPCVLAAGACGRLPLPVSWKALAGIFNTKATTPQTTTRLLLDGESLISPRGGTPRGLCREREGISLALFSLLRARDGAGTSLFPHLSPCSAGFGATMGPDRQQTSQPEGGRRAAEH